MQIVGRSCQLCHAVFKNEIGAYGCEACDLAVHGACVARSNVGYRDDASGTQRRRGTPCPGCGDDLRARKRRERRQRELEIARAEAQRPKVRRGEPSASKGFWLLLVLFGLLLRFLASWIRWH